MVYRQSNGLAAEFPARNGRELGFSQYLPVEQGWLAGLPLDAKRGEPFAG